MAPSASASPFVDPGVTADDGVARLAPQSCVLFGPECPLAIAPDEAQPFLEKDGVFFVKAIARKRRVSGVEMRTSAERRVVDATIEVIGAQEIVLGAR